MVGEVDEYVHRIGKYRILLLSIYFILVDLTRRVGNTGKATSFYDEHDAGAAGAGALVEMLTKNKIVARLASCVWIRQWF